MRGGVGQELQAPVSRIAQVGCVRLGRPFQLVKLSGLHFAATGICGQMQVSEESEPCPKRSIRLYCLKPLASRSLRKTWLRRGQGR